MTIRFPFIADSRVISFRYYAYDMPHFENLEGDPTYMEIKADGDVETFISIYDIFSRIYFWLDASDNVEVGPIDMDMSIIDTVAMRIAESLVWRLDDSTIGRLDVEKIEILDDGTVVGYAYKAICPHLDIQVLKDEDGHAEMKIRSNDVPASILLDIARTSVFSATLEIESDSVVPTDIGISPLFAMSDYIYAGNGVEIGPISFEISLVEDAIMNIAESIGEYTDKHLIDELDVMKIKDVDDNTIGRIYHAIAPHLDILVLRDEEGMLTFEVRSDVLSQDVILDVARSRLFETSTMIESEEDIPWSGTTDLPMDQMDVYLRSADGSDIGPITVSTEQLARAAEMLGTDIENVRYDVSLLNDEDGRAKVVLRAYDSVETTRYELITLGYLDEMNLGTLDSDTMPDSTDIHD